MSRCSMCGGTGRTEPTALDRLASAIAMAEEVTR